MENFYVDNKNGWRLHVRRVRPKEPRAARPVLVVPGYGMNSFIFGFHPKGPSLLERFAERGIDAFAIDLRGQGESVRVGGSPSFGLAELAIADVRAGIAGVLEKTGNSRVDLIGCSLGAALVFAHLACTPDTPVGSLVSMAGVVTWKKIHPIVRAAFFSRRVAGAIPIKNTRTATRVLLPVLAKAAPKLLGIYLNEASTDLSRVGEMVQTVEDPVPQLNREIADWIKKKDLIVRGVNVSRSLRDVKNPFMGVLGEGDGVVPKETSAAIYESVSSPHKEILIVGGPNDPIAHGDLFLCNDAQTRVYDPIADFLIRANAEM